MKHILLLLVLAFACLNTTRAQDDIGFDIVYSVDQYSIVGKILYSVEHTILKTVANPIHSLAGNKSELDSLHSCEDVQGLFAYSASIEDPEEFGTLTIECKPNFPESELFIGAVLITAHKVTTLLVGVVLDDTETFPVPIVLMDTKFDPLLHSAGLNYTISY